MTKPLGSAVEIVKVANGFIVWGPYEFQTNGRRDMASTRVFESFAAAEKFLEQHFASVEPDMNLIPTPYDP